MKISRLILLLIIVCIQDVQAVNEENIEILHSQELTKTIFLENILATNEINQKYVLPLNNSKPHLSVNNQNAIFYKCMFSGFYLVLIIFILIISFRAKGITTHILAFSVVNTLIGFIEFNCKVLTYNLRDILPVETVHVAYFLELIIILLLSKKILENETFFFRQGSKYVYYAISSVALLYMMSNFNSAFNGNLLGRLFLIIVCLLMIIYVAAVVDIFEKKMDVYLIGLIMLIFSGTYLTILYHLKLNDEWNLGYFIFHLIFNTGIILLFLLTIVSKQSEKDVDIALELYQKNMERRENLKRAVKWAEGFKLEMGEEEIHGRAIPIVSDINIMMTDIKKHFPISSKGDYQNKCESILNQLGELCTNLTLKRKVENRSIQDFIESLMLNVEMNNPDFKTKCYVNIATIVEDDPSVMETKILILRLFLIFLETNKNIDKVIRIYNEDENSIYGSNKVIISVIYNISYQEADPYQNIINSSKDIEVWIKLYVELLRGKLTVVDEEDAPYSIKIELFLDELEADAMHLAV